MIFLRLALLWATLAIPCLPRDTPPPAVAPDPQPPVGSQTPKITQQARSFDLGVEQVVLELQWLPGKGAAPVDRAALEAVIRDWLTRSGIQVVPAWRRDPQSTHHLGLAIQTLATPGQTCMFAISQRLSLLADRDLAENPPGVPQRIWFANHVAAQKGPVGFQEHLQAGLTKVLGEMFVIPLAATAAKDPVQPARMVDYSKMRVLFQPAPPYYPPLAKINRVQGTVVVEVLVDDKGQPIQAFAVAGPAALLQNSVLYILQWQFAPAILDGVAQPCRFRQTMTFLLR